MNKRTFFKSIMSVVAAVALAPEIAFRTKLALPELDKAVVNQWWLLDHEWKVINFVDPNEGVPVDEKVFVRIMAEWNV